MKGCLKFLLFVGLFALSTRGHAGVISATAEVIDAVSDNITQVNPVTGMPSVNIVSFQKEIELGKQNEAKLIEEYKKQGFVIDADDAAMARISRVLMPLIQVCHLPKFPWRYHYINSPDWNAFASPGGSVWVLKGLLDSVNDTELAAILGHELAHVTCRHIAERMGQTLGTMVFTQEAKTNKFYQANYSTEQENQADAVGLWYMAAAGFDPMQASPLWERMYKKYGSMQLNYQSDHGLTYERAALTKQNGQKALKYYLGAGKINPNPDYPKNKTLFGGKNKTVNLLLAAAMLTGQHDKNHAEAENRQKRADILSKFQFLKLNLIPGSATRLQATVKNSNTFMVKRVIFEVIYQDANGQPLRTEPWGIDNMQPNETRSVECILKTNPNEKVAAQFAQVDL